MTDERLARAVPWTVLTRIATLASTLAVSAILYRSLSGERFGLYTVLRSALQYTVLLVSFGLDRSLLRYLPEARARDALGAVASIGRRVVWVQLALAVLVGALTVTFAQPIAALLGAAEGASSVAELRLLMLIVAVATAFTVAYQTASSVCISAYRTEVVSGASAVRGLLWVGATALLIALDLDVAGALWAEALSMCVAAVGLGVAAARLLHQEGAGRPPVPAQQVVARRRQLAYAGVIVWSGVVNLIVSRQSEVFFLAHWHGLTVSGDYDLCYSYPQLALEFVPLAAAPVVTSAIAEAFGRDRSSLKAATERYYRLLGLLSIPVAVLGVLWSDLLLVLLFGGRIAPSAHWAQVFSVIHLVPLVFVPLSTALMTVEKAHKVLHLGLLQVATNIGLDLLLIERWGFAGAVAAVAITLVTMTPITLWVVGRQVGGTFIPAGYFARVLMGCLPAVAVAVALRLLLPSGVALVLGIPASTALIALGLRRAGALGPEELDLIRRVRLRGRT